MLFTFETKRFDGPIDPWRTGDLEKSEIVGPFVRDETGGYGSNRHRLTTDRARANLQEKAFPT